MALPAKRSTTAPTRPGILKNQMVIGIGGVEYDSTYQNVIGVPNGGYAVHTLGLNNNPITFQAANDAELVAIDNHLGGDSTTAIRSYRNLSTRNNTIILDNTPHNVVTNDMVIHLDGCNLSSWPRSGNRWRNISKGSGVGQLGNWVSGGSTEKYLNFDGVDDRVLMSSKSSTNQIYNDNELTMQATVKIEGNGVYDGIMGILKNGSTSSLSFGFRVNSSNNLFFDGHFAGVRASPTLIPNMTSLIGRWINIATTYTSGRLYTYVNGELVTSLTTTGQIDDFTDNKFQIGGNLGYGWWQGDCANTFLYNVELKGAGIKQNYHQAPIVTDGLVLALDAGNLVSYESGSTTTHSLTGSIDGALYNGTDYSDGNGGVWVFDGVDDRINFTPTKGANSTQNITVSSWVNCSNVATPNNIVSKNGPYFMRIVNSRVRFNIYTSTGWLFQNGTTVLSNNTWYNFSMVYDGTTWKGFIDGVLEFSTAKTGTISANANLFIGYTPSGGEQAPFDGKIASVHIYDKALSPEEVAQNYNAQKTRFI